MATKRARKSKAATTTNTLLEALRFVSLAQNDLGPIQQTHCMMCGGYVAATDGVLTAAAKIEDDLTACPQTRRLVAALERSGDGVTITQTDGGRLSVKSGPLRAVVPCVDFAQVSIMGPDANVAPLTPLFLEACKAIQHVAHESGQSVDVLSLLVEGPIISATNRQVLVQYRHGNNLPPYFVLPKTAVTAIVKSGKVPTGFGYTQNNSATFWFDDGSWLKTQLYEDRWPNVQIVFDKEDSRFVTPIPDRLFEAMRIIGDFSDCGKVHFYADLLKTVNKDSDGAEHDVKGLIEGPTFSIKNLELIAPIAKLLSLPKGSPGFAFFYGENMRGAISYQLLQHEVRGTEPQLEQQAKTAGHLDDDIPF